MMRAIEISAWCLVVVIVMVAKAGCLTLDTTRIYTLDDLEEIRLAIAYEKCLKTPGCEASSLRHGSGKCQVGSGLEEIMEGVVDLRSSGGCNPLAGEVVWPKTGQCVALLTQGPCPPGQWVKLTKSELEPVCEVRPCVGGPEEEILMGGSCHATRSLPATTCPPSQRLITNEFGEAECECEEGLVYYEATRMCYTPYTQGPCNRGFVIKVKDEGTAGRAMCMPNPCPAADMAMMDDECHLHQEGQQQGRCHTLDTQGPCTDGSLLSVDNLLAEPICITTHSIFNFVHVSCGRGSRRDRQGRCRPIFNRILDSVPSYVTSRPGGTKGAVCAENERYVAGACLRLAF